MMNFRLGSDRAMAQRNGGIYSRYYQTRMFNNYQLRGGHLLRAPQPQGAALQRPQNYPRPSNFMQGNYHENNIVEANPHQSVVPLASSSNNNGSTVPAARHDGNLPLSLPRANPPPPTMCTLNMALSHAPDVDPVENSSSSNNVGLQGLTNNIRFPNSAKATIRHHLDLANMNIDPETNSPYPNPSHHLTNSAVFKDLKNAHNSRVDRNNSFHSVNNHIARPMPRRVPVPGDFLPPPSDPTQTLEPSSNANGNFKDLALERAMKRPLCEVEGTNDTTGGEFERPMVFIPTPSFGGPKKPLKELNLFKDRKKKPCPPSRVKIEEKDEDLDLSLHL